MMYVRVKLNHPSLHTRKYAFSWTTPPPFERAYFMDGTPKFFILMVSNITNIVIFIHNSYIYMKQGAQMT